MRNPLSLDTDVWRTVLTSDMDDFETLALSQQPASEPWTPVTDYSFEARKAVEGQHPQLIKDVFQPRTVLDVGCGFGHLVRLLRDIDVDATGCDVNLPDDLALAVRDHVFRFDISTTTSGMFDLLVCREVLEHMTLRQIRSSISNLCLMAKRFIYVTTRFSSEHDLLRVETSDDLDPTHITIPSKDLLRLLFVLEGFKRRADLEAAMDWKHLNRCLVYERAV